MSVQKKRSNLHNLRLVLIVWLAVCLAGSLPYLLTGFAQGFSEALFLSVSAFTTTGAVLRTGLDGGIFLYYLCCQWFGGIAILVFLSSLLPSADSDAGKNMAGRRPGRNLTEALKDRDTWLLVVIYALLTLLMFVCMLLCGHTLRDALMLALTVCSTGGFTPDSLGGIGAGLSGTGVFSCIFMLLSTLSFTMYAKLARKDFDGVRSNTELRLQAGLIAGASALIAIANTVRFYGEQSLFQLCRDAVFQVISFQSTTGLTNVNISLWPGLSRHILILLSFCGGAAVSTGSGIKLLRIILVVKSVRRSFLKRIHPRAVMTLRVDGKPVPEDAVSAAEGYFILYILVYFLGVFLLSFSAPDMETAFYGAASLLNNVGAGFGCIGTDCAYGFLDGFGRVAACVLMLAGRLEIYALVIPFASGRE